MQTMSVSTVVGTALVFGCLAQAADERVVSLYSGAAPGSESWGRSEQVLQGEPGKPRVIFNVARPTLTVFQPETAKANGTAVVICPGGGFFMLTIGNEGYDVAHYLTSRGLTCFVLKYRLLQCKTDDPLSEVLSQGKLEDTVAPARSLALADGLQAIKIIRLHAKEYGINPDRIGILGFSAGGSLAVAVGCDYDAKTRPAFVASIYGGYDLATQNKAIRPDAPPLFVAAASDDQLGLASQSVTLYQAWIAAKKPAELHIYATGGHAFGMKKQNLPCDSWADRFVDWLEMQGHVESANQNGAANGSQPIRSETNTTSSAAGSRR
jgi:acetyl esterase/lipase